MSTPLWRQVIEGTYDPFSSSFDLRQSGGGGFEGLDTDWRAFQIEQDAARAAETELARQEREALELQGQEYVNLAQSQGSLESAVGVAEALGQPGAEPQGPPTALEGIANVLDAVKSGVIGGLSGLMGWDIQGDEADTTKFAADRFVRQEDIVGDRSRLEVAWERALKGLFGGQSYGFGDFEALRYEEDDPRSQRVAKGLGSFTLDVIFDPLTYFSFGSSVLGRIVASTGVRVSSRSVAQEVLEQAGEAATRTQVERLSGRELMTRVAQATGRDTDELLLRTPQQLVDDLFAAKGNHFIEAAADSWSFGNAAAYGARGRTGLYDRLVETVGSELADSVWTRLPADIRGGARIRVPFRRTVDEFTGMRVPTVIAFPGSQPGRGFDVIGMGNVVRKMNQARLKLRTGPFKFLEDVSGARGKSWTNVLNAARAGDAEAIEAYALHFGAMAFDDQYRIFTARYDQLVSADFNAVKKQKEGAVERGLDVSKIDEFVSEAYFKRGRVDAPVPSSPEDIVGLDIVDRMFAMTDNVHRLAVEIYGKDAASKMQDYATRMLTTEGIDDLIKRYGPLEGRRRRLAQGAGRLNSSFPKSMDIDKNGNLIVTAWMTPDEIFTETGRRLFIADPFEAVAEYMTMMRRELSRDWALNQLQQMGLLVSIGEDVLRQPTVRKIQSEVQTRMVKVRDMLNRLEKGERIPEVMESQLEADRAGLDTVMRAAELVEVESGHFRSTDGLVEVRRNRSGGWSASVAGDPVQRPVVSQPQMEGLVPEAEAYSRVVDWDEARRGFYDEQGNRIPARQVRMEGTDDPRWVTSTEPAAAPSTARGPAVAPDADDARQISGTWDPWLSSGANADIEYVHKVLLSRIAIHENGGRSVNRRAYLIHKRDLEILEELHPRLKGMVYDDAAVPASSMAPNAKYRIEVGPDGSWRIVENVEAGEAGVTIVSRANDTFQLSNGKSLSVQKAGDFWEVTEVDPSTGLASVIMRGTNKKRLIADVLDRFPRGEAPAPEATPVPSVRGPRPGESESEELAVQARAQLESAAPKRAPQTPSAPDRPAWGLTPEEFEASGRTLLHGAPQEFDFFDSMQATYRGRGAAPSEAGRRFYFTDDPEVAGRFRQNIRDVSVDGWLNRTEFDLADLEDPEIFALFAGDVNAGLRRRNARLQQMNDEGDWVDMDPDDLTFETIQFETPLRAVSERGQVIETRVFGREVDLTGDLSGQPEELLEALRLDGILDTASGKPKILGYSFPHERRFENTAAWMRENGYGRAVVPDASESGGRSYIGLEEYIEYGRTSQEIYEQVTAGRAAAVEPTPAPQPAPIKPGLRREFAGRYKYTRENGEQLDIVQVRPEGKAQVWRVTDAEGVDIGDFARREDAVAFIEGRPAAPRRATITPENRALVVEIRRAMSELSDVEDQAMRVLAPENIENVGRGQLDDLLQQGQELSRFLLNSIEILSFDNPALARRLVASRPGGESAERGLGSDVAALLSDAIEDVASRAPRATPGPEPRGQQYFGQQQYFEPQAGVEGFPTLSPSARLDFESQHEAVYHANRVANRVRDPKARVVRDEVWETNRAALIDKLRQDYEWLEAALGDGRLLRNQSTEDFDTWVERVITFLQGVDPSIQPFDNAIDKSRYTEAARAAGLDRFATREFDPVVAAIINENDLFGPEILAETIKRHFALPKQLDAAEKFFQNFWRPYYTASKSWMTQGRGYGYTSRNIIGSMYNAWLADVRARHFNQSAAMLAARRKARDAANEVLERRPVQAGETTAEAWERVFYGELKVALREGGSGFPAMSEKNADYVVDAYRLFMQRNYGGRTARSRTWGELLDRGTLDASRYGTEGVGRRVSELYGGKYVDELTPTQRALNASVDNAWMRHVTRVNESSEDYLRFAAFLRGADTYGLEDGGFGAGTLVVGTQFDYADLSNFERRVMKNIIPFYTWTRRNVPLQIRSVWMEPGKVNRLLRFNEEVMKAWTGEDKEQDSALPEWLRRRGGWMTTMQTPGMDPKTLLGQIFGLKADPIAAFIESPLTDLGMLFNATLNPLQLLNRDEIINYLNPILGKAAFEAFSGRSYTSGRELDPDGIAPRWAQPWALLRNRRNDDGELVFSQNWAQFFRNMLPPFAQAERLLAPLFGDERMRRRWLTTMGSQILASPLYTVDPNQQAFAISNYAQGINEAVREGVISFEDKRDAARGLLDMGYDPAQIAQLGLSELDPEGLNFEELARARRNVSTEEEISAFLETLPPETARTFIFRRGFRGLRGHEAVEAWENRQPINELGALFLPEIDAAFSDWFARMPESDKLGLVFQYGYGPHRGAEAVRRWSVEGGLPNRPPGLGSADFLS